MKNDLASEAISAVRKDVHEFFFFFKYLLTVIQEKVIGKSRFSMMMTLAYITRILANTPI